jgi:hypothetical protein
MRPTKKSLSFALVIATLSVAPSALAQEFGKQGDAVFAAERLFGFTSTSATLENPGPGDDVEFDGTNFSLGWRGSWGTSSPYEVPRLAFDYLVIDSLSVGGSLGFASISEDVDGGFLGANGDGTSFLFAPRVGYIFMFNDVIGIWPRGGFTYHSQNVDDSYDANGFGLNLEAMFPIIPTEHFGFLVGPTLDLDFTGSYDPDGPADDVDLTYTTIGIQAGLFGWL